MLSQTSTRGIEWRYDTTCEAVCPMISTITPDLISLKFLSCFRVFYYLFYAAQWHRDLAQGRHGSHRDDNPQKPYHQSFFKKDDQRPKRFQQFIEAITKRLRAQEHPNTQGWAFQPSDSGKPHYLRAPTPKTSLLISLADQVLLTAQRYPRISCQDHYTRCLQGSIDPTWLSYRRRYYDE